MHPPTASLSLERLSSAPTQTILEFIANTHLDRQQLPQMNHSRYPLFLTQYP